MLPSMDEERPRGFITGERGGTRYRGYEQGPPSPIPNSLSLRHLSDRGANRVQLYTQTIRRPGPRSCSVHAGASALAASGGEILWHQRPPAVCRPTPAHKDL